MDLYINFAPTFISHYELEIYYTHQLQIYITYLELFNI